MTISARELPWRRAAPYALLILAVLLAYANVYRNDFLFDDLLLVSGNKFLTGWRYAGTLFLSHTAQGGGGNDPFYRPLQMLLYLAVYQLAGPSRAAFHLLNVALHALNACLLYALGVRLGFRRAGAWLATLVWALHPVHTEAVAYMSGTADPLCGALLLTAIYVLAKEFSPRRMAVATGVFAVALLAKETAVVFPLLAMGLLFYQSERRWSPRTYLKSWPFWAIAAVYLAARHNVFGYFKFMTAGMNVIHLSLTARLCTFLATLPAYLRLLVWPAGLHMERGFPLYENFLAPPVLLGFFLLMAAVAVVAWRPQARATPLAWGLLWAGALQIPVSGIFVRVDGLLYEHWLYLPAMGLALGTGETLARTQARWRPVLAGAAVLAALALGTVTFLQNRVWRDAVTFYNHILACGEDDAKVHNNLGYAYQQQGRYDRAATQFRLALALTEAYPDAHFNLAIAILHLDRSPAAFDEAIAHLQRAAALNPDDDRVYQQLADIYSYLGDDKKSLENAARATTLRRRLAPE